MNRLYCGVGINDADYIVNPGGRKMQGKLMCPFYTRWCNMIKRCYDKNTLKKRKSYDGCSVCDEWLTFSNFKKWMESQEWDGKHLDKDILTMGNKIYSPETCFFVSNRINNLHRCISKPSGFNKHKTTGKWRAYFYFEGKQKHLGLHASKKEAAIAAAAYRINFIDNDDELSKVPKIKFAFKNAAARVMSQAMKC